MGEITLHVAQIVTTVQMKHFVLQKHGSLQVKNVNALHKGDDKDDDYEDDNNNCYYNYLQRNYFVQQVSSDVYKF